MKLNAAKADRYALDFLDRADGSFKDTLGDVFEGLQRFKKGASSDRGWRFFVEGMKQRNGRYLFDVATIQPGRSLRRACLVGCHLFGSPYNRFDARRQDTVAVSRFVFPRDRSDISYPPEFRPLISRHALKRMLERCEFPERMSSELATRMCFRAISRIVAGDTFFRFLDFCVIQGGYRHTDLLHSYSPVVPFHGGAFIGERAHEDHNTVLYRTFLTVEMLSDSRRVVAEAAQNPCYLLQGLPVGFTHEAFDQVNIKFDPFRLLQSVCLPAFAQDLGRLRKVYDEFDDNCEREAIGQALESLLEPQFSLPNTETTAAQLDCKKRLGAQGLLNNFVAASRRIS